MTIELMQQALTLMQRALDSLDEAEAPGDIGAHLDMAICRLRETLEQLVPQSSEAIGGSPSK